MPLVYLVTTLDLYHRFQVLEGKSNFVEFGGNLVPVTKSGDQLSLRFFAFRENRLPFNVKIKDPHSEPMGRIAFMKEPKVRQEVMSYFFITFDDQVFDLSS